MLRHYRMSATKARQVLDLIRGRDVLTAAEILAGVQREAAGVVQKVLASAVANATNNDAQVQDELYVASAYADEGPTIRRFRPRARGRATRIRKRSCHVTIVVARMDDEQLRRVRASRSTGAEARARRVAGSRRRADQQSHAHRREVAREEAAAAAEAAAAEEAAATEGEELDEVGGEWAGAGDETGAELEDSGATPADEPVDEGAHDEETTD